MDDLPDSRQLRVFVTVARHGNMRRAAQELSLTPSAVSHALRSLEEHFGATLFTRTTRVVQLTHEGEQILPQIQRLLSEMASLTGSLRKQRAHRNHRLRLGASPTASQYLIPAILRELKESLPELTVMISSGPPEFLIQEVTAGRLDLLVSPRMPDHKALTLEPIARDVLAFVVNPLHPWARSRRAVREEIGCQRFVVADRRSYSKRLIDDYFQAQGLTIEPFIEVANEEVIKELVRIDLGVGIIPPWIALEEVERGLLATVSLGRHPPTREWVVAHRPEHPLSFGETLFLGLAKLVASQRIGWSSRPHPAV